MPKQTYKVEVKGVGQLHTVSVLLENIPINLTSTNYKTWTNNSVELDVVRKLELKMECFAMSGTDWTFTVKNVKSKKVVYEDEGTTGDKIPNFSRSSGSVDPA